MLRRETSGNRVTIFWALGGPVGRSDRQPRVGLQVVLRHAFPLDVHDPKVVLGAGVPLLCSLAIPGDGLLVVLRYTFPSGVNVSKVVLGI